MFRHHAVPHHDSFRRPSSAGNLAICRQEIERSLRPAPIRGTADADREQSAPEPDRCAGCARRAESSASPTKEWLSGIAGWRRNLLVGLQGEDRLAVGLPLFL